MVALWAGSLSGVAASRDRLADHETLDANLAYALGRASLEFTVFNVLDEEYFVFGLDIPTLGGYAGVVAPEATYGVTLRLTN